MTLITCWTGRTKPPRYAKSPLPYRAAGSLVAKLCYGYYCWTGAGVVVVCGAFVCGVFIAFVLPSSTLFV